ncbi:MAG: ABC transporter permease, partial [Micrococcales bacterium]|nr:ABC transporter permease [Micrococcales bacterium]
YLTRRLLHYAAMTFVATSLGYLAAVRVLHPQDRLLQGTPRPTPAQVQARLAAHGLDPAASAWERYAQWVKGVVLHWDWGSGPTGEPISAEFVTRALVSGRLVAIATILQIVIGVALGVYTASRQYRLGDRAVTMLSYLLACIPAPVAFLWVQLGGIAANEAAGRRLVYVSGIASPVPPPGVAARFVDAAAHLALPTIGLTLIGYGGYQLMQRAVLLDEIGSDYVRTARAKGLTRGQAIRRHALRTSFVPIAQNIAFTLPAVFAGTFVLEQVFAWEGLGRYLIEAITRTQDVNAVVASIAFGGALFAVGAIIADTSVALIDPRVVDPRARLAVR